LESSAAGFEPLLILLRDDDENVVRRAARSLGIRKDPRAAQPLLDLSSSRYDFSTALVRIGPCVVDQVIAALGHPRSPVRRTAARVLGALKAEAAVDALIAVSRDHDEAVRCEVIRAPKDLACEGCSRLLQPLMAALSDREGDVRDAAVEALGRLKDPRAVSALEFALRDPLPVGRFDDYYSTRVRGRILEALGLVGGEYAVQALVRALPVERLRIDALDALEACGDASAVGPLLELLQQMESHRSTEQERVKKTLCAVLERSAQDAELKDLRTIADLPLKTDWFRPSDTECGYYDNSASGVVNWSPLKQLARQELVRRGVNG
jgi:HEAT repeat protein